MLIIPIFQYSIIPLKMKIFRIIFDGNNIKNQNQQIAMY